jgi:hypothetical protein
LLLYRTALQSVTNPNRIVAMTEIVSVSAAIAAYATEGLRPSARVSGSTNTQETAYLQNREARATDNFRHAEMMNIVGPPAIAVFFLTAGERNRVLAQTTMREAEQAYSFGKAEVEEARGDAERQSEESASDEHASEDNSDHEPPEEQTEVLALPSPEDFS